MIVAFEEFGSFSEPYLDDLPKFEMDFAEAVRRVGRPSDHLQQTTHRGGPRLLIFLSHFLSALRALAPYATDRQSVWRIRRGVDDATNRFLAVFSAYSSGEQLPNTLLVSPYFSPFLLLYARACGENMAVIRSSSVNGVNRSIRTSSRSAELRRPHSSSPTV